MSIEIVNLLEEVVQRAGFEPANRYGLGPHPSAFDQAGRPLQQTQRPHSRISTRCLRLEEDGTARNRTISLANLAHIEDDWIQPLLLERFQNGWIAFCD